MGLLLPQAWHKLTKSDTAWETGTDGQGNGAEGLDLLSLGGRGLLSLPSSPWSKGGVAVWPSGWVWPQDTPASLLFLWVSCHRS